MKVRKSELRKMIKEAVYREVRCVAEEQKNLSEYSALYLAEAPFLVGYKVQSKKALLEFFGPFKSLKSSDLEKMTKDREVKHLLAIAKSAENARKKLGSVKLSNVDEVRSALDNYVVKLTMLWDALRQSDVDESLRDSLSKLFAAASYTIQALSMALANAANKLYKSVPHSSGVYSKGREAMEVDDMLSTSKKSAKDYLGDIFGGGARGMGVGRRPQG